MARTRLFSAVARALRAAARFDAQGVSTREGLERERRALREREGFSRRAFLQGAGVAVSALAASRALTACNVSQTDARVVVVGAGLAGLTVAYRLTLQGFAPMVFDAAQRVGGRCLTDRDSAFNNRVDLGGEFIDTGHRATQDLAAELSLPLVDLAATYESLDEEVYSIGGTTYTVAQMAALYRRIVPVLRADFAAQGSGYVDAFNAADNPAAVAMDRMSLREWFDRHAAEFDPALRTLFDVAYTSEYGLDTDQQSYLNLLYLIYSPTLDTYGLFGDSDGRYVLRDGADAMTTALASQLATPVTLGAKLTSVRDNHDGTLTAVFANASGGPDTEVDADKLVLALPFNQLRRCDTTSLSLEGPQRTAIENLRYGTTSKVVAATNGRPWVTHRSTGTSYNDGVYDETWDAARGFQGSAGILVAHSGGALGVAVGMGSADDAARAMVARADTLFPGVAAAYTGTNVRAHWPSTPFIEGSYACYGPGDRTTFGGYEKLQAGNVHFAGEHTSEEWQGSINGAIESGERVAQEILNDLGG